MHSTSANTGRLTATTAGVYSISGPAAFDAGGAAANSRYQLLIRLNGSTYIAKNTVTIPASWLSFIDPELSVQTIYKLAASDYVELLAYQETGSSVNVTASGNFSPEFACHWLGDG